ncbi:MAG: two-component system OmpR family response regulator [Arenicella sp.]|jgi:two-component system OmpR family response regulator
MKIIQMKQKPQLLLVEDDLNLGELLKDYLEMEDFNVILERDGVAGLKAYQSKPFDLCILDVMMPKVDGITLAKQIRSQGDQIPIIFLTAKSLKEDKKAGYDIGADDYLTKPFDEEELVMKLNAILRRSSTYHSSDTQTTFEVGKLTFDYANQELSGNGSTQRLTAKECDILRLLCINKGQTLKREDALVAIWGENDYFHGRSFDVFITKIRKYLKQDESINIKNIHGVGFRLTD